MQRSMKPKRWKQKAYDAAGIVLSVCALLLAIYISSESMKQEELDRALVARRTQQAEARAAHDRRLVKIYERALSACMNGIGFGTKRAFFLCYPEQVSGD